MTSQKILQLGVHKVWRECGFFMRFGGPFCYDEHKAGQDKMFILTVMLYCTSKSCKIRRLNNNFSCQGEKASSIGNRIGHNFDVCIRDKFSI